jgi:hypothetical protein
MIHACAAVATASNQIIIYSVSGSSSRRFALKIADVTDYSLHDDAISGRRVLPRDDQLRVEEESAAQQSSQRHA